MAPAGSILFVTLDSCRYDTFAAARVPNMKALGPLHRAMAPSYFTYGSHAAMFMGFTPGDAARAEPYINPKYAKVFKLANGGSAGHAPPLFALEGENIIDGLRRRGYLALGTAATGWFAPATETGRVLSRSFERFFYPGDLHSLGRQVAWLQAQVAGAAQPVFAFLNVGETHVPYYHEGAPWDPARNPCVPFARDNDAFECRRRQTACVEFVDGLLGPLLERFSQSTVLVCADHGDCWGEDGLWEHGVHHEKTLEVPLLLRLGCVQPGSREA
jgi:hypothetical protein